MHEQIRRADTIEELHQRSRRVAPMLAELLSRGLASGKVIAVHSAILDTIVRRALVLTFADEPEVSLDAFTWLALGSNGRREAVLGSDVDSAVAFDDDLTETEMAGYRTVFGRVDRVLSEAGLIADDHGATPARAPFARSGASWRSAARHWLADPADNQGAIMTSLLVDGRPIHGDPGLPAVASVFGDLRAHTGTMRLLLQESLSKRARLRSVRDVFARRDTLRRQDPRPTAPRQSGPLVGPERRVSRSADHRETAGGIRLGDIADRGSAQPDRGLRDVAAASTSLSADPDPTW